MDPEPLNRYAERNDEDPSCDTDKRKIDYTDPKVTVVNIDPPPPPPYDPPGGEKY